MDDNSWKIRAVDFGFIVNFVEVSDFFSPSEKIALILDWLARELLGARSRYASAVCESPMDARLSDLTAGLIEAAWRLAPDLIERGARDVSV